MIRSIFNLKNLVIILLTGAFIAAAFSIAYYYGYALPKKDQEVLELQKAKLSATPIPTLTPTPTAIPLPTAAPRWIYPTLTPTFTALPSSSATTQTTDVRQAINEYATCKQECPKVGGGKTCTENKINETSCTTTNGVTTCTNTNGGSSCRVTSAHPDEACIKACQDKYGLNF